VRSLIEESKVLDSSLVDVYSAEKEEELKE
jgi:hypothetical protein